MRLSIHNYFFSITKYNIFLNKKSLVWHNKLDFYGAKDITAGNNTFSYINNTEPNDIRGLRV